MTHAATGQGRRRGRTAIVVGIEIAVGLALLCGAHYVFTGHLAFGADAVHPFWLVVVLVAVQYGTGPGIAAALAASLVGLFCEPWPWRLAAGAIPIRDVLATPALWLLAAVILGGFRDRDQARIRSLERALAGERARVEALSELSVKLKSRLEDAQFRSATGRGRPGPRAARSGKLEPSDA